MIDSLSHGGVRRETPSLQGCPKELTRPGKAQCGGGHAPSLGKLLWGTHGTGHTDVVVRKEGFGARGCRKQALRRHAVP